MEDKPTESSVCLSLTDDTAQNKTFLSLVTRNQGASVRSQAKQRVFFSHKTADFTVSASLSQIPTLNQTACSESV